MQQNGVPWVLKKDGSICRSNLKPPTRQPHLPGLRGMVKIAPDGTITRFDKGGRGIAFDAKGNLFAANGTDILKFAPGETKAAVYESGLDRAWALTVDPQGNVLFTEFRNIKDEPADKPDRKDGATYKLSPDHVKTIFDEHTPYAYGLATDAKGDIYLAGYGNGGDIYKYAIAGPCVTKSKLATIPFAHDPAVDAHGNVFVNGVRVLDPKKPWMIKGSDGQYHRDPANSQAGIFEIPKSGGEPRLFVALDGQRHPVGLAFEANGDLYSADYNDGRDYMGVIYRHAPDGTCTVFASGLNQPMWLAFEPDPTISAGQGTMQNRGSQSDAGDASPLPRPGLQGHRRVREGQG